jgi:hypothetical protein
MQCCEMQLASYQCLWQQEQQGMLQSNWPYHPLNPLYEQHHWNQDMGPCPWTAWDQGTETAWDQGTEAPYSFHEVPALPYTANRSTSHTEVRAMTGTTDQTDESSDSITDSATSLILAAVNAYMQECSDEDDSL